MIDIEVQGFQSIGRARIRVDGFSALVGRSNIGKSAFIRAVRCALTNPNGTSFVRHGRDCARLARKNGKTCKCQASVHIKTEGFDLLWEKGDSINRYAFNGQRYDKPGPGVPEFLCEAGFAPVKVGEYETLQVADQFFPIFLLDQSGPVIAETISDVSRLDRINTATKLAERDRREAMSTRKVREGDVKDLESQLAAFDGMEVALASMKAAEAALQAIEEAQRKVDQLERYWRSMVTLAKDIRRLQGAAKIDVQDTSALEGQFAGVQQRLHYQTTMEAMATEVKRLQRASKWELDDPDPLMEAFSTAQTLARFDRDMDYRLQDVDEVSAIDSALRSFPEEDPFTEAAEEVVRLDSWVQQIVRHKETQLAHQKIAPAPDDPDALEAQASRLRVATGLLARMDPLIPAIRGLDVQARKLAAEETAIDSEIDALGVCPTCARPLKEAHTHAQVVVSLPD